MRALLIAVLASGMLLAGCGQAADGPSALASPAAPTSGVKSDSQAAAAPAAKTVEVPFHSEITWTKVVNGGVPDPCQGLHGNPPAGMSYLMRNTSEGPAVSTHLGTGNFEIHTCVYGTIMNNKRAPAGWFADMRWTAANGDVPVGDEQVPLLDRDAGQVGGSRQGDVPERRHRALPVRRRRGHVLRRRSGGNGRLRRRAPVRQEGEVAVRHRRATHPAGCSSRAG